MRVARNHTFFSDGKDLQSFLKRIAKAMEDCMPLILEARKEGHPERIRTWMDGKVKFHPATCSSALLLKDKEAKAEFWRWLYPVTEEEIIIFDMVCTGDDEFDESYQTTTLFEIENEDEAYRNYKLKKYSEDFQKAKNPISLAKYVSATIGTSLIQGSAFIEPRMTTFTPKVKKSAGNKALLRFLTTFLKGTMVSDFSCKIPKLLHNAVEQIMKASDEVVNNFCTKTCNRSNMKDQLELITCAVYTHYIRLVMMHIVDFAETCSIIRANSYLPELDELKEIVKEIDVTDVVGMVLPNYCPDELDSAMIAPPEVAKEIYNKQMNERLQEEIQGITPIVRKPTVVS